MAVAMPVEHISYISEAEYLDAEERSPVKHEWVGGYVHAMAGATKVHGDCVTNCVIALASAAREHRCRLIAADLLVQTANAVYYPDVVVACDSSDDPRIERRPCLIVEVASPSTAATDRREKLLAYLQLATLVDYWIVDVQRGVVEVHHRGDEGWTSSLAQAGDTVSAT